MSVTIPFLAAERVLNELSITKDGDLQQLELIAWERGAMVCDKHLDGCEARLTVRRRRAIICVSDAIEDPRRRRFSIAHELGHLEMHSRRFNVVLCTDEDLNDWAFHQTDLNLEQEANEFAAALLLPERFFAGLCRKDAPSLGFIAGMAGTFTVSLTATSLRYLWFCGEPCAVVFSQDGHIRWFRRSKEFEDIEVFIESQCQLDPSSYAASFFEGRRLSMEGVRVPASAWFAPGRYRDDATILENSWPMPSFDAVLTLLWVDADIEEDDEFSWL